jgi:hypothetical protein
MSNEIGSEIGNEIGERFARAIARKDGDALFDLLEAEIDFRGLTPSKVWDATTAREVVDNVLFGAWFDATDHIDALEELQTGAVADRDRVSYRFRVTNPDGVFLVEQQAYFGVEHDRISFLRILCSGFRRVDDARG